MVGTLNAPRKIRLYFDIDYIVASFAITLSSNERWEWLVTPTPPCTLGCTTREVIVRFSTRYAFRPHDPLVGTAWEYA